LRWPVIKCKQKWFNSKTETCFRKANRGFTGKLFPNRNPNLSRYLNQSCMKGSYGSYVLYTNERETGKVKRKVHQKKERTGQEGPKLTALLSCAARDRSATMMTAAMRSALAMLSRRSCGGLGSSAAASVATRGLEI
jgi:hypothetical protein